MKSIEHHRYGMRVRLPVPWDSALERTRAALAAEGFGVLAEIDVSGTLRKKLGVEFRPYTILGACNPPLAHRALTAEPDIGLLLPCNVVVYAAEDGEGSVVAAMDPEPALALTGNEALKDVALEVRARLERALTALAAG
jgi:uncharacterized protein (DUF302 family)